MFFRRLFSFVLMLLAIACFGVFAAFVEIRYWAVDCEVSQVFKLTKAVHLPGGTYAGLYDVAVTPLTSANKLAQICGLVTLTPIPYVNVLDKKVWLVPLHEFQFAYYETPGTRSLLYVLLTIGVALLMTAYALFGERER